MDTKALFGRDPDSRRNVSDSVEKHFSEKRNHLLKSFG